MIQYNRICFGDSGSPLVDESGTFLGVASFIITSRCANEYPDFYTRISTYSRWVKTQICAISSNPTGAFGCVPTASPTISSSPTLSPSPTNPPTSPPPTTTATTSAPTTTGSSRCPFCELLCTFCWNMRDRAKNLVGLLFDS